MKGDDKLKIFLVDDDSVYLKLLEIKFRENPVFNIETYQTGELCIEKLSRNPDLIILDYHLDGMEKNAMTGIQTLDKIKNFNSDISVVMLSAQDNISVAINCMNHRAADYVVKSETSFVRLQKIIDAIFSDRKMGLTLDWYMKNGK